MRMFCFDLDDTLVSENQYVESGLRAVGPIIDEWAGGRGGGGSGEWLVAEWRRTRGRDLFQRRLQELALDPELLPQLIEGYRNHSPTLSLRDGAREVLERIVRGGDRLSLISDGVLTAQRRKWDALRLPFPFEPVIFTDARGRDYWKPHPWAFEVVMAAARGATAFVYIADNDEKDFVAPNRLGWTTVHLRHRGNLRPWRDVSGGARAHLQVDGFEALLASIDVVPAASRRRAPRSGTTPRQ